MLPKTEWPEFCKLPQLWYGLFNVEHNLTLQKRKELTGEQSRYIVGIHPHGLIPYHGLIWASLSNQYLGLKAFGAAADICSNLPVLRNILGYFGIGQAGYDVLRAGLTSPAGEGGERQKPSSLFLMPGGQPESSRTEFGVDTVVFNDRRGLVKLSIEQGVDLLPVYVFGASDFYNVAKPSAKWRFLTTAMEKGEGFMPLFTGKFGIPFIFPLIPRKLIFAVGTPIKVAKWDAERDGSEISEFLIDETHASYLEGLEEVFEKYSKGKVLFVE